MFVSPCFCFPITAEATDVLGHRRGAGGVLDPGGGVDVDGDTVRVLVDVEHDRRL